MLTELIRICNELVTRAAAPTWRGELLAGQDNLQRHINASWERGYRQGLKEGYDQLTILIGAQGGDLEHIPTQLHLVAEIQESTYHKPPNSTQGTSNGNR